MRKQNGLTWVDIAAFVVIIGLLAGGVLKWLDWIPLFNP